MSPRLKIVGCRLAKLALYPLASVGWTVAMLYQDIDAIQGQLAREAGLDREWNEWRERQARGRGR